MASWDYDQDFSDDDGYDANDPRPATPGPARSAGFAYGSDGFRVGGIERMDIARIRLKKFTKPWFTAQLKLYGVPFNKNAKSKELLETLIAARKHKKTKEPTEEVNQIERRLKDAYEQSLQAHPKSVEDWRRRKFSRLSNPDSEERFDQKKFIAKYFLDTAGNPAPNKTADGVYLQGSRDSRFISLINQTPGLTAYVSPPLTVVYWRSNRDVSMNKAFESLSAESSIHKPGPQNYVATREAEFDVGRFMSKYFLDDAGKPCPTKSAAPIILGPFTSRKTELRSAVEEVPKLQTFKTKDIYGHTYLAIGWGSKSVACLKPIDDERKKQEKKQEEERRYREQVRESKRKMEREREERLWGAHRRYVQAHTPRRGPLKLAYLRGTYRVEILSKHVKGNYCNDEDDFSMSICSPQSTDGCLAAFSFPLIEGTMLLAVSEDDLEAFVERMEATDSEDEGSLSEEEYHLHGWSCKRKAKKQAGQQQPIRRRLSEVPQRGRVYLKWAGRDPNSGEVQFDEDEQTGFIDFAESGYTADGRLKYPNFFGSEKPIKFRLYKTLDTPSERPEPWSDFREAYDG